MEAVLAAGFRRARVLGFVGWGRSWHPDAAWLRRCEAEVGRVVKEYPMVAMHLYDVPGFAAPEAADFGAGSQPVAVHRPDR
jgi:hypothetical protein